MSSADRPKDEGEGAKAELTFSVDPELGEGVSSELMVSGHPGVREVRVVGTTREDCNLIVTVNIREAHEPSALVRKVDELKLLVRERVRRDALVLGIVGKSIFPPRNRHVA